MSSEEESEAELQRQMQVRGCVRCRACFKMVCVIRPCRQNCEKLPRLAFFHFRTFAGSHTFHTRTQAKALNRRVASAAGAAHANSPHDAHSQSSISFSAAPPPNLVAPRPLKAEPDASPQSSPSRSPHLSGDGSRSAFGARSGECSFGFFLHNRLRFRLGVCCVPNLRLGSS
jgi:hypothetical protein